MSFYPVIVVFSPQPIELQTAPGFANETCQLDCRWYASDALSGPGGESRLNEILARVSPRIIVSFGRRDNYLALQNATHDIQQRWLHLEGEARPSQIEAAGAMAFARFFHNALSTRSPHPPLVSVFTPTYRTGEKRLQRAYASLQSQEYSNWEWVVLDDSDDGGQTLKQLEAIAALEPRLKVFPSSRRSGIIGQLKRRACSLCEGDIFVEFDHDDELTPNALGDVVRTFAQFPEAGFTCSDWAEVREEDGASMTYVDNWAFGYGSYRETEYRGRTLQVAQTPPINAITIRHIVSAPNHLRAWKREDYWRMGGHNADLHVADDYELVIRSFLNTRMARIPRLCYLQHQSGQNTTDQRRGEIQRLVRNIAQFYDGAIHARLLELGLEDPAWDESKGSATYPFMGVPGPRQTQDCLLVAEL